MKRFLSYIWPITKYVESTINGRLEITWYNGKKLLDVKNANYSYGTLQNILRFGLDKIDLRSVSNVLVLGMGGGSIIHTLRKELNFLGEIVAVEIDPKVVEIAKTEFQIFNDSITEIIIANAFDFVKDSTKIYDLIIIDIFIYTEVPSEFYSKEFWKNISSLTSRNGYVIFNAGINLENQDKLYPIISSLNTDFVLETHDNVQNTNTLLIGKKLV